MSNRPTTKKASTKAEVRANGHDNGNGNLNGGSTRATNQGSSKVARTTAVLPIALNENWEAFALLKGRLKNDVLVEALTKYLEDAGFQPDKRPKVQVTW